MEFRKGVRRWPGAFRILCTTIKKKDSHKIRLSFYNFSINVCDNSLIFFFGSFNGFQADMRHFVTLECRNYVQVEIKRVVFR